MSWKDVCDRRNEALRISATKDLLAFTLYTKQDYQIGWHHRTLAKKLTDFANGAIQYLMVFMPPRHGKSELVSRRLPAFLHGKYPDCEIMAASYLDSLAGDMTIDVQNIIDSKEYKEVFPETKIWAQGTSYSKGVRNSSEHHIVGRKGKYRGQGVGGSFTGKGANFIIIDDPIKGREIADSVAFRERLWNFYNNDLFSRLETDLKTGKRGQVLITQCMTGDTQVLMADGTETSLRDVKIGDAIACYENGYISSSKIKNWKSQGPDFVFAIRTSSGIIVKANERHPFLVCRNGYLGWVRLRDLKVNDALMRVGGRGREDYVPSMGANCPQNAKGIALPIITSGGGHPVLDPHPLIQSHAEMHIFVTDTELVQGVMISSLPNKMANALSVKCRHQKIMCAPTGEANCALTMITSLEKSEDSCATIAILPLDTERQRKISSPPLSTCKLTLDFIVDIKSCGKEDVFDVQVDRTENFIANGLVSHNTRWHEDDLSGRLIDLMNKDPEAPRFEIIKYPAIRVDMDDPSDQREIGQPLWPQKYNLQGLGEIRAGLMSEGNVRGWSSLYQQDPIPDGGCLFKEEMFEFCDLPGGYDWKFITADTAYKEKNENDFTVFSSWGVTKDQLYLLDVFRKQIRATDIEAQAEPFIRRFIEYGYRGTWIEPKGHGIYLNQKWANKGIMIPSQDQLDEFYKDRKFDKVERATNVAPHLANRKVYISNQISIKEELVAEAIGFPKRKHDDFVDTLVDALKKVYSREVGILDVL